MRNKVLIARLQEQNPDHEVNVFVDGNYYPIENVAALFAELILGQETIELGCGAEITEKTGEQK